MEPALLITAAVCTYDRYPLLEKALDSLRGQTLAPDRFEVIVADNTPPGSARDAARQRYERGDHVRYLLIDRSGLSNARNVAARAARAPVIAYLDDDAVASPGWLEEVVRAFEKYPDDGGIVGGRIDPMWGGPRPEWLTDQMLAALSVVDLGGALRIKRDDEWIAGANFSVRVEPLLDVGGFPTDLGRVGSGSVLLSNEETKVINLFAERGLKVVWAPDAAVRHLVDASRLEPGWFRRRYAWQAVSDMIIDPERTRERATSSWGEILAFFNRLPPRLRTMRGLFAELDDPEMTAAQIKITYDATILLLSGFDLDAVEHD